jgi:6-methylsalicylic acid synthase
MDDVAVIGIGCRFPGGADTPDAFWDLLISGRRVVGDVPADRWAPYRGRGPEYEAALRRAIRAGSYLDDIAGFDAEFFELSPREAAEMDPQQRLLLEVSWEALEHAGVPPGDLAGTDAGVFIGLSTTDYGGRLLEDLPGIQAWTGIGAAACAVANRISHALDLRGPSMAVDTACSASLVAIHLASQSLRLGESSLAIAGGVSLVVSPGQTLTLDEAGALAPDGRSKSFDATADGYGRGEGCGVLVLKRLADAERDGDRVLAVVRGGAVSQDGRTNGIMAPCGAAQEHVVHKAWRAAGVAADSVDYVEAHGTGTRLGDPVEAAALAATYGAARGTDRPCRIGSVKANIGHLEGAAGIAGAIKVVLALDRGQIPPTPLSTEPNPAIPWADSGLSLVTDPVPWPRGGRPRRAAVSAFGYGGTIAHLILEEAPVTGGRERPTGAGRGQLYPLSAASPAALTQYAGALADWIESHPDVPLASIGYTLARRRSHLPRRAVAVAADRAELVSSIRHIAGEPVPRAVTGTAAVPDSPAVWVFSGHGAQWAGMGRDLLAGEPAFAAVIDDLEPVVRDEAGFSLRAAFADGDLGGVDRTQIMIFAMHAGLAAVWREYGARPAAVIGHSVGEIAAAVTCGALSLTDGARLVCRRSLLVRRAAGAGGMAMVTLPFDEVERRLAGRTDVVAAVASSPSSSVVAGDVAAIEEILQQWPADGVGVRRVRSDVAFHSPHMDPLVAELVVAAAPLASRPAGIPWYSTALPDPRATTGPGSVRANGGYWATNLRRPVHLVQAVAAALEDGHRAFLEISPHPVVAHAIQETLDAAGVEDGFVGTTLRRDAPERETLLAAVARAHCHGVAVDWATVWPAGDLVSLPPYAWQRQRHWRDPSPPAFAGTGHDVDTHTLLGEPSSVPGTALRVWRTIVDDSVRPYPGSHEVQGVQIVPAAVLALSFRQAAARGGKVPALADVTFDVPLPTSPRREVQIVDDGQHLLLASRELAGPGEDWLVHARATPGDAGPSPARLGTQVLRGRPVEPSLIRDRLAQVGVRDTAFAWHVERLLVGDGVLRARVSVPRPATGPRTWAGIFDAATSIAPAVFPGAPALRLLNHIDLLAADGDPPDVVMVEATRDGEREDTVDVLVAAPDGRVVASLAGLRYPVIAEAAAVRGPAEPAGELAGLDPDELLARLVHEVGAQIAAEMKLPPTALDPRRPLVQQGLDSVMTVIIRRRLEKRYGHMLPASLFWQQPTVTGIAEQLARLILEDAPAPEPIAVTAR